MIRTIPIASGVTAVLRSEFSELVDAAGQHRHTAAGEPLFAADLFVSGGLRSPFAAAGEAGPAEIRVRVPGRPSVSAGVVRLDGAVRLSTWTQRSRGVTRTDAVLTCERVVASSDRPSMRGPLPVDWDPSVTVMFLDYLPANRAGEPGLATIGISPVQGSPWVVDGLGEIHVNTPPSADLVPGQEVELVGMVAAFHIPDEGSRDSARLVLGATRIEARQPSGGRGRKAPEPVVDTPAEAA